MPESRWQDIFVHLGKNGFNVFPPGVKVGECTEKYIVVKNDGSTKVAGTSTEQEFYSVMCYVPLNEYSKLEVFKQDVKKCMSELSPMIKRHGKESPSFTDDKIKSHMISIEYSNYKKV